MIYQINRVRCQLLFIHQAEGWLLIKVSATWLVGWLVSCCILCSLKWPFLDNCLNIFNVSFIYDEYCFSCCRAAMGDETLPCEPGLDTNHTSVHHFLGSFKMFRNFDLSTPPPTTTTTTETEKCADAADSSVFFSLAVLIFWLRTRKLAKTLCF